ncbi:MAG: hypothetical protein JWQ09_5802 [Segetibacter sp.]|nr:hypothetical protein [Segetibacter sp.]
MPKRTYDAHIIHTGIDATLHFPAEKFVFTDLKSAFGDNEKVTVEIKTRKKPRNLPQNAYLHMSLQMIADETGNSLESVKSTVKAMFAKKPLLDKDGEPIYDTNTGEQACYIQDTRDMSTQECFEFTEQVRMFALDFCGIILPLPDENIKLNLK